MNLSCVVYQYLCNVQLVFNCHIKVIEWRFFRIVIQLSLKRLRTYWIYYFSFCHRIVMIYIKLCKWCKLLKFA